LRMKLQPQDLDKITAVTLRCGQPRYPERR
jgi:hypothetical protein